jgi:hypothetical protein
MPTGHYDRSKSKPRPKKRFCKYGHDMSACGRDKHGHCSNCHVEGRRKDPSKDSRIVQFCPKGHDTFIVGRTSQGRCKQCHREHQISWAAANPEYVVSYDQHYYEENKEAILEKQKQRYEKNKKEILERLKKYRENHPEFIALIRLKNKENRALRIPKWADLDKINEFERNKPDGMTTDHYIPLQGDLVSGLHVSWNLQYLTVSENTSKNNKCDLKEISDWYGKLLDKEGLG